MIIFIDRICTGLNGCQDTEPVHCSLNSVFFDGRTTELRFCEHFVIFNWYIAPNSMIMSKILIIEDDRDIAELIAIHMKDAGFEAEMVHDGKEGLIRSMEKVHDLVILDLKLPGMDGLEICRKLRVEKIDIPIIMLTSKSEEIDKVLGLEIGADDYITKPFSIRELLARVKTVLRRGKKEQTGPAAESQVLEYENFYLDITKRKVRSYGQKVELSPKEFDLLVLLASHPGKTYSRSDLLSQVWGVDFEGFEHTVNSHINRLRSKIEKNMNQPEFIQTTWGVGYKFKDELS
jgi:DNA-binding response OmpR family regulator